MTRKLGANPRWALLALPLFALAASARAAESIDTGTARNSMHSCPVGSFVVGVDLAGNRLLCSNTPVVNSQAPYTTSFEIVDTTTRSGAAKTCPTGYGITGVHATAGKTACAHVGRMDSAPDSGGSRQGIRACPSGRVAVGINFATGQLLCGQRVDFCYGALGSRCGITGEGLNTPLALCVGGTCLINAGSWEHDSCCWRRPNGKVCRAPGAPDDGACASEFQRALERLAQGYNWKRTVDFQKRTLDGNVVAADYCAQAGWIVHRNDVQRCCSRSARAMASALTDPVRAGRDAAQAVTQAILPTELAAGNPRVCN